MRRVFVNKESQFGLAIQFQEIIHVKMEKENDNATQNLSHCVQGTFRRFIKLV